MKYRKKPIVIDAVQWHKPGDHLAVFTFIELDGSNSYKILTLEGVMNVKPGDWIITGVKGERYPCKPDIFEMTYEPADEIEQLEAQIEDLEIATLEVKEGG